MQICTCELPPILRWFTRTKTGTRGRGIGSRPAARSIQGRTNRCKCVTNIMFVLYHLERRDVFCPGGGIRAILFAFVCHAKRSLLGFRHAKREKGSPRQAKRTFSGGGHGNRPRAVGFCGRHHKRRPRQARVEEALARCIRAPSSNARSYVPVSNTSRPRPPRHSLPFNCWRRTHAGHVHIAMASSALRFWMRC